MAISYNLSYYNGLRIRDYDPATGIEDPTANTYRIRVTYDDSSEMDIAQKIAHFTSQDSAAQVAAIVLGSYDDEERDAQAAVNALVEHSSKLPALRHIFMGDISYDEYEMSWINSCDMAPLLHAFPELESFGVRGFSGLSFNNLAHSNLKKLVVQTGGMSMGLVSQIIGSELPVLEHLELWLGSDNYGWDGDAESLKALHDLPQFPNLTYLGLCNSIIADSIAASLGNAPILGRIETLSLHNGNLSDEGARALMANEAIGQLKKLDLHYHYISYEVQSELKAALKAKKVKVDLKKGQGVVEDPEERYIRVSE